MQSRNSGTAKGGATAAHGAKRASTRRAPVSELDTHLGFWLRFVSNHVSGQFKKLVESNGVSVSEWVALRQLFNAGDAAPFDLIDALGMTKGTVSKVVSRLEDKGLVERALVESDGRARQIVLTPAGRALVPRLAALADHNDEAFFGHLSPEQRAHLVQAMKDLVRMHRLKQLPTE